jgi:group I intron endonuclease
MAISINSIKPSKKLAVAKASEGPGFSLSGIYQIALVGGGVYVGSSVNIHKRWGEHRAMLSRGKHSSPRFQYAWNKYGSGFFRFSVLEVVVSDDLGKDLQIREQFWIDLLQPIFNVCMAAYSTKGTKRSPASVEKTASKLRGQKRTPESIARMRAVKLGITPSDETREKMRVAHTGRVTSEVTKEKLRRAHAGKYHSPGGVRKMADMKRGVPMSEAQKEKIRASCMGKNLGRTHSEEAKAAMRAKALAHQAAIRASKAVNQPEVI